MNPIFKIMITSLLLLPLPDADLAAQEAEQPGLISPAAGEAKKEEPLKRRINWEDAEGAIEYRVQIIDSGGKIMINATTQESSYDVELPEGDYRIRIGAVNKFGKVGSWSDWANIAFEEEKTRQQDVTFKTAAVSRPMVLKIGAGPSYFQLLPEWSGLYENSFHSTSMQIGAAPLDFSYFRFAGLELDSSFTRFESKQAGRRIRTNISSIMAGLNAYIMSWFDFPVNLIFRFGGGIAFTEQEYEKFDPVNIHSRKTAVMKSRDAYYKAGIGGEYRPAENLYLQAGADFYLVRYLASDFKGIKYFVMIGTGI